MWGEVPIPDMIFERVDYPLLFSLLVVGACFVVAGLVVEALGMASLAGFFAVYSVTAFLLGGVGYVSLFLIKQVSRTMHRRRSRIN